ncbi:hypothetical protein [Tolypothrix sp. NIES-4075]|nr:hypothetical protein [Tolypothrix sp. NIES-4075]
MGIKRSDRVFRCPMPDDGRCYNGRVPPQRTASPMPHAPLPITHSIR